MAQELHLFDGLLLVHGRHGEALDPDDAARLLLVLLHGRHLAWTPAPTVTFALVAGDLAVHLVHDGVNGGEHVGCGLFGAQDGALASHRQLGHLTVLSALSLLYRKLHPRFGDGGKVAIQLADFLLHIFSQAVGHLDVLALDDQLHLNSLLLVKNGQLAGPGQGEGPDGTGPALPQGEAAGLQGGPGGADVVHQQHPPPRQSVVEAAEGIAHVLLPFLGA